MRSHIPPLILLAVAALPAADYSPPKKWGKDAGNPLLQAGQPTWRFDQVWPPTFTAAGNFVPMVWTTGRHPSWGVETNGFGGQPTGSVQGGKIRFGVRGPRTDARPCMAALAFAPAAPGTYGISAVLDVERWEGGNEVGFSILRRDPAKGTVILVKDFSPEAKPGNPLAAEASLAPGEELLLVAKVDGFNTAATMTLKDLVIRGP